MSWTNELYRVYELVSGTEQAKGAVPLLPVSHSTANAQIEVTVDESGEFVGAGTVDKEHTVTVIPVTEASGARSSGIAPMPLADKLIYVAGDYGAFADDKRAEESFDAYISQLKEWSGGSFSHPAVRAVYEYLSQKRLMHDLIACGVLETDGQTGRLSDRKLNGIPQKDAFVRFIVSGKDGIVRTWLDTSLYKSFAEFNGSLMERTGLCYATGAEGTVTYKHPSKIRNSGDMAKLISSNDESGFTYRGRFENKEQAFSVGYEYSQKIHNALKWLVGRQSRAYDSLTLITWNSALGYVPEITQSAFEQFDGEPEEYASIPKYSERLNRILLGGRGEFSPEDKVMIMGLDAAGPGRLSIALYSELESSRFYENIRLWHEETAWIRYNGRLRRNVEDSCSIPGIADCLYGTEQNGRLECDKKIQRDTILRLLPCAAEHRPLPRDIVRTLCQRASQPLSYEQDYNFRKVLETACALIRKAQLGSGNTLYCKGEINMAYDPGCTDRSYLYGYLLAVADKAEQDTYDKDEGKKRITNARRYWSAFASRPYQTWKIIEERLRPYLDKDNRLNARYTKHINGIMEKFSSVEEFADDSKLSPMYLIGYHHYNALLWAGNSNENNEEE